MRSTRPWRSKFKLPWMNTAEKWQRRRLVKQPWMLRLLSVKISRRRFVYLTSFVILCTRIGLPIQVAKWRAEKAVLHAEQVEQESALLLEQQAIRDREESKRRCQRQRTKVRLDEYRCHQEERRVEEEAWLAQLRMETEEMRREKAARGQTRVNYRREQQAYKLSQQVKALEEKEKQAKEKEQRLDALRKQVLVYAQRGRYTDGVFTFCSRFKST